MSYYPRARSPSQFAMIPRNQRRTITIDLTDPAFDAVIQYAVDTNGDGSFADSLREMILASVSGDLTSTVIRAAREQAKLEASRLVRQVQAEAIEMIHRRLSGLDLNTGDAIHGVLREGADRFP